MKSFNCAPNLSTKLHVPRRCDLLPVLKDIEHEIVDRIIHIDDLIDGIAHHLAMKCYVNVMRVEDPHVLPGDMDITAHYDQAKDRCRCVPIELTLVTFPLDTMFLWDKEQYDKISKKIADALIHEYIHMKQARARYFLPIEPEDLFFKDDKEDAQYYLGQFDEIDAYSHNIANELTDHSHVDVLEYLSNPSKLPLEMSGNLWAYINTFDKDIKNPKIKRLLKKVYKNYQNLKK